MKRTVRKKVAVMRMKHLGQVAIGILFLLGMASADKAQESPLSVLSSIRVKQLVASATRPDHAQLRDHFAALSARYAAEAKRNTDRARVAVGNPNRPQTFGASSRWLRLAEIASDSAEITRALAQHHERLAAGLPSTAPPGSARFEAGEGAPDPSDAELRELGGKARTSSDHTILADYFASVAERHERAAGQYLAKARASRASGMRRPLGGDPAVEFERMAKLSRQAAAKTRAEETEHRKLAGGQ